MPKCNKSRLTVQYSEELSAVTLTESKMCRGPHRKKVFCFDYERKVKTFIKAWNLEHLLKKGKFEIQFIHFLKF